jgi:hypothetical protein
LTGQITFLIAALGVAAVFALEERPALAGVLFGIAATLKPQAMVLLPLAMAGSRQWRVLAIAAAAALACALVSLAIFGPGLWTSWWEALPRFQAMIMANPRLTRGMITPTAVGMWLGLGGIELALWGAGFGVIGAALAWRTFRVSDDPARRLTALFGGALFVSPYAMHYDAALLAPAAVLMLSRREGLVDWILAAGAGALLCCAAIPHWGAAAVTAFVLMAALAPETLRFPSLRPPTAATPAPLGAD